MKHKPTDADATNIDSPPAAPAGSGGRRPWRPLAARLARHRRLRGVWTGLGSVGLVAMLLHVSVVHGLDNWFFDGCFAARESFDGGTRPSATRDKIVLITLDEPDFDGLEKPIVLMSPELGLVIGHARASGATAVGVDMMIPNSQSFVDAVLMSRPTAVGKVARDANGVVLAVSFPSPPRTARWPIEQWLLKYRNPDRRDPWERDVGSIDMAEDADRFIRTAYVVKQDADRRVYPSFPLALAAWAEDKPWDWEPAANVVRLGDTAIPIAPDGTMRINWVGPPGTFATIPFREVLAAARADKPVPILDGRIALIGTIDPAFQDFHPTPYSNGYTDFRPSEAGRMAGVEIHANTIATIRDGAFITTPWWLNRWPWLIVFGLGLGWVYARVGLGFGLITAVAHHFGWKMFAVAMLTYGPWRVDMAGMLLLGTVAYAATFANRWRILRRVLSAVKSSAMAKALEDDPGRLDLAGENRTVTVMFVDIRGFSSFSSRYRPDPERVVNLLNAYYSVAVPIVEAEGGTINLFMGDGMMILFNAPLEHKDHAVRAVRAGRSLVRAVRANAATFAELGAEDFRIGVGINTGICTVGAVGSRTRLDYTAIGDVVNAAARLEAATKEVGAPILIGPDTHALIPAADRAGYGCPAIPREVTLKGVGKLNVWPVDIE